MVLDSVYDILISLLPMIILFSVVSIATSICMKLYAHKKLDIVKFMKNLIFSIYLFSFFYLVTTTDFESYSNNFIPFKEITRYKITSPLFWQNVVGNIILFIPFGVGIADKIKNDEKKSNLLIVTLLSLITSVTIEVIQMFIGRSFDIDDIMLNVFGGIIGYFLYVLIHNIHIKLKGGKNE